MSKYSNLTPQEATALIKSKTDEAEALIREAESIADAVGVGFSWDLAYGMGGYYRPAKEAWQDSGCEWEDSDSEYEEGGWQASSEGC